MSANQRGFLNRWMKSLFGQEAERVNSKPVKGPMVLEALESRTNPAFNLTIGGGTLTGVTQTINAGTMTLTANATGANIPVDVIANFLAGTVGNTVLISNGAGGTEPGNISWLTNPLDCAGNKFGAIGLNNNLTINFDATTTTGQLKIADNMIVGDSLNAVKLNLDTSAASSTPPSTGLITDSQIVLGAIDTGVINLNAKASTSLSLTNAASVLGNVNLDAQNLFLIDGIYAGGSPTQPGNITIGSSTVIPSIQVEISSDPQYSFQATGTTSINGTIFSTFNSPVFLQSNLGTQVAGDLGVVTPTVIAPLGALTLSGPGPINLSGKITADAILIDPANPNFNLTMSGGSNILNQINTAPTNLNNNGTLSVGSTPTDYYLFGSGFQSNSLSTPINITGTIASSGAPISIGNLNLQGNSGIDTTNKNATPVGGNITLGSSKGGVVGNGSNPNLALNLNSGTAGNISVVPVMQNINQVVITNANKANFSATTKLGTLTVNNLTAGNSVTFESNATINTMNLGTLGANSSVLFSKTGTVGQVTSKSAANYSIQFNGNGTLSGPLSGGVNIVKAGTGNSTLSVAGATGTYTGGLTVNNGNLAVNSNFASSPVTITGGALTGTGPVGVVTTSGTNPKTVRPGNTIGNMTVNTINLGSSTQLAINLQSANGNLNGRLTATPTNPGTTTGVTLSGASLDVNLVNGFFPSMGSTYTIINNQSNLPTTGTFFGLPEGGTITVGGATFAITYAGGNGNDVVLTTVRTGTGTQGYVRYLYSSILNRAPDESGLATYTAMLNNGVPRSAVTAALWTSPEHRALQVQQYFLQFLNRAPSAAEQNMFVNAFLSGAKEETIMTGILTSAEFQLANPPVNAYITALYTKLLGRQPSIPELNQWRGIMFSGVPRSNVVQRFLYSTEYLNRTVAGFYSSYLGRPVGGPGLAYWVGVAQANQSQGLVAVAILSSTEAFNNAVAGG